MTAIKTKTIHGIFFSPTGTTRQVVRAICAGTGYEIEETDLTRPGTTDLQFTPTDRVVIGLPVYSGRLPAVAVKRLAKLQGNATPATVVVVYGNCKYDDALLELYNLCAAQGFQVTGAAAYIGKHSFASEQSPLAAGRPDKIDLESAAAFGKKIIAMDQPIDPTNLPGNHPYRSLVDWAGAATGFTPETCTGCGVCAAVCPTYAITMQGGRPVTKPEPCIWCMACVQHCPTGSRKIILEKINDMAARLYQTYQTRQEPEIFPASTQGKSV